MRNDLLGSAPDVRIKLLSISLDDVEAARIANENRLRQLTRNEPDEDGVVRGLGLPLTDPMVKRFAAIVTRFQELEHETILTLQQEMKQHPLSAWMQATPGLGLKQGARLLASVAPVRWNGVEERERTVSELWSFAGLGLWKLEDGSRVVYRREKGKVANWSPEAKKRSWLCATSTIKVTNSKEPNVFRGVYDARRAKTAERVHERPCVRCGPSGKPALPGTPLSPGHQHADALRIVAKEILKEMWLKSEPIG
jgi:hypothetical protein